MVTFVGNFKLQVMKRHNTPELAKLFKSDELKEYLKNVLRELDEDDHEFKSLLKHGHEKYYSDLMDSMSKEFIVLAVESKKEKNYTRVERCIDGATFDVGEKVFDKIGKQILPIGRLYEDDRGLHVRLDFEDDDNTITWRNLSHIKKHNPRKKIR